MGNENLLWTVLGDWEYSVNGRGVTMEDSERGGGLSEVGKSGAGLKANRGLRGEGIASSVGLIESKNQCKR
jgi:hypothetical protein